MNARTALLARVCACAGVASGVFAFAAAPHAQGLSALSPGPIALADGHVTIGGDVSASFGSDDAGFFNYTDYEHSALRMVRINVSAAGKAGEPFSILRGRPTENLGGRRP